MSNKLKYEEFCVKGKSIPIFSQAWWLDATCGNDWDVSLVEKDNEIVAAMPYAIKKRFGFTLLSQPALTQNLGPWIKISTASYSKALSQEKDIMQNLIEQLPKHQYFQQNWHYSRTNWLPFYWKGFEQTTRYTYVIDDLSDLDKVWDGFESKVRGDIRKAQNKRLSIRTDLSIDDFIKLNQMTFSRQDRSVPYSGVFIRKLVAKASERQQCQWFIAQDQKGQNHAGVLVIWDVYSAYYLMGGGNPELRNSGATSLCMWEAIQFASTVTQKFDFEGSMIESIERFFRGFGAIQKPYIRVSKVPSRILKFVLALQDGIKS